MKVSAGAGAAAVVCFLVLISVSKVPSHVGALPGSDVNNHQVLNATPMLLDESVLSKEFVRCARVSVSGISRLKLDSYSSARRLSLVPSDTIPEKAYRKIRICFQSNSSLGLCQCESELWESIDGGIWSSVISPYEDKYIDVKFTDNLYGFVTVTIKLEFQRWRLICLAIGLSLLLLAPIISSWVPFYYGSSMAIGICLVVIIILFQGMKLLPTGRKNALYSALCTLALGVGSFLLNRFSVFVNSVLNNLGINQEMHNPVLIFFLVGILIAGAGFGYWLVRKFVVSKDGSVDTSVSQFVKWSLRVIAVTFIFQSTLDMPLALVLLGSIAMIYFPLTRSKLASHQCFVDGSPLSQRTPRTNKHKQSAEFFSKTSKGNLWRSPKSSPSWSNSPVKGVVTPSSRSGTNSRDYYSTFHKMRRRNKFTDEQWKDFTEESTHHAVAELASSPDFADWIINNANRIRTKAEVSSDECIASGVDTSDEDVALSSSVRGFLWPRRR